jgi:hypothetical protein
MPRLSFKKNLRSGQQEVLDRLATHLAQLNVKLPTGYGKTFTFCAVYSTLQKAGRVNRLLVIFPTDKQLDQFLCDAPNDDLPKALVDGPWQVVDIRDVGLKAIKAHRTNERQIFATTIQSLIQRAGAGVVGDLLQTGQWMVVVDEYHHYGTDKTWGRAVLGLNRQFLLVLSATPHRPYADGAFGPPDVEVTYEFAQTEGAVKRLLGHAYHYSLDVEKDGEIIHLTTAELIAQAGGAEPDRIEKFRIERKMRWSPKFISPLVAEPIDRMLSNRIRTGFPLQVLIAAICVSHAEFVCGQVQEMYPELAVDWVGTGDFGRSDETNKEILAKFCPAKNTDGVRDNPTLDVLVHVGMAGEGLDSILVSEIVELAPASLTNSGNQLRGRAARVLRKDVEGHINFDASSELAIKGYIGANIMRAMDELIPVETPPEPPKPDDDFPPEPPAQPEIQLLDMKFEGVDHGDATVQSVFRFREWREPNAYQWENMRADHGHADWSSFMDDFHAFRAREAELFNDKATLAQSMNNVKLLLRETVGIVIKKMRARGNMVDQTVAGMIKHRINARKRRLIGELNKDNRDIEAAKAHYAWLRQLNLSLRNEEIPQWLFVSTRDQ